MLVARSHWWNAVAARKDRQKGIIYFFRCSKADSFAEKMKKDCAVSIPHVHPKSVNRRLRRQPLLYTATGLKVRLSIFWVRCNTLSGDIGLLITSIPLFSGIGNNKLNCHPRPASVNHFEAAFLGPIIVSMTKTKHEIGCTINIDGVFGCQGQRAIAIVVLLPDRNPKSLTC